MARVKKKSPRNVVALRPGSRRLLIELYEHFNSGGKAHVSMGAIMETALVEFSRFTDDEQRSALAEQIARSATEGLKVESRSEAGGTPSPVR